MAYTLPQGFRAAGVSCGIKQDRTRLDLALIASDTPCSAAGVYTQNRVAAAPVMVDRHRTPADDVRAVVVNSGNANACTGQQGFEDARKMAQLAASACGVMEDQVLVMSTGIIGVRLPMDAIARGVEQAVEQLRHDESALFNAACGFMTTDTRPKLAQRKIDVSGHTIQITGIAKGAAMIGPQMATMLGLIITDASLLADDLQTMLREAVDESFNCISVEGHTSTNDTVLMLANATAMTEPLAGEALSDFAAALSEVCVELAKAIPDDGEGATHLIEVRIRGCGSRDDSRRIAKAVADSPLVKTAIAGADPNWGRIVSAAGYAGVPFEPERSCLWLNDILLYQNGTPVSFDAEAVSASIRSHRQTSILLDCGQGDAEIVFWTCDLTAEYVRLNADYHT